MGQRDLIGMENLVFLKPDGNLITLNRDNEDWRMYLDLAGVKGWRGHLNRLTFPRYLPNFLPLQRIFEITRLCRSLRRFRLIAVYP